MPILLAVALIVMGGVVFYMMTLVRKTLQRMKDLEVSGAGSASELENLRSAKAEFDQQRREMQDLLEDRARAVTERGEAMRQLDEVKAERNRLREDLAMAQQRIQQAEKETELTQQKMDDTLQRMQDWEKLKEEMTQNARASLLKAGSEMSSKLLEDHKREAAEQKKQQEEQVKQTTEKLFQQFTEVSKSVFALKEETQSTRGQMDTVMRALTNPGGAGHMAEVGLENSLKNLGLQVGRDFIMQYHIAGEEGRSLRPDAVIFLPQDVVMVVDAKASKFLLELAEAEGTDREQMVLEKLKKTMQDHVKALAGKDYKSAIQQSFREAGREGNIGRVFNVMYLPTDHAVEHVMRADPGFTERLEQAEIIPTGPTGLSGLFLLARQQIAEARQFENQQRIIASVEEMMDSVVTVLGHVDSVGKGIKSTADAFDKFGRSVNTRLLPKLRKLSKLGVVTSKTKELPSPVPTYEVRKIEETITLEADVETPEMHAHLTATMEREEAHAPLPRFLEKVK